MNKTDTKPALKKHGLVKDLVKGSLSVDTDGGGGQRWAN